MTDRRREFERRVKAELPDPQTLAFFADVAKEAMQVERRTGTVEFGWHFSTWNAGDPDEVHIGGKIIVTTSGGRGPFGGFARVNGRVADVVARRWGGGADTNGNHNPFVFHRVVVTAP